MNWYLTVLKQYATFSGRARRKEYWMFTLINMIIMLAIYITATVLEAPILGIIFLIYVLALFIPNLAVTVRRLHDTNRSGWWFFISLVPFVGGIVLFIFLVIEGTNGENQFGADPKR